MKVFFDATPSRLEEYGKNYQLIGRVLEELGHELTSRWILDFDESFYEMPRDKWGCHYREIVRQIEVADVAVVDVSVSSTTCGQMIQIALMGRKPVIALTDRSYTNIYLEGAGDMESKLMVVEYDLDSLREKLEVALEYVEEWLETRFTMILDGKTRRLLDEAAKSGESRSEYLRRLVNEDRERRLV